MRTLRADEIGTVSGGTFFKWNWNWCKPAPRHCKPAPKPRHKC